MAFFGELLESMYRNREDNTNFLNTLSPIVTALSPEYMDTQTGTRGGGYGKYLGGILGGVAGSFAGPYGSALGGSLGYNLTKSLTGDTAQQPRNIYRDLRSSQAQTELQDQMIAEGAWRSTASNYVQNILDKYTTQSKERGYNGRY